MVGDGVIEHLTWYTRRLRAMSPAEIAGRSRRELRHSVDAASYHVAPWAWRARWEPEVETLLAGALLESPKGFLRPERALGLRQRFPAEANDLLLARAEALVEGRVRFFGYPEVIVSDWTKNTDPHSGRSWPAKHGKRIDYRRAGAGDPKWIWELHRCQHLPLLAAAWLVSGDSRYGQAASSRLSSWIDAHPPGRGVAWTSGFEAGMRAISLAVTLDALRGTDFLPSARLARGLRSLWQHGRWIERDPSTGSSANNHRIGELVGLVAIGCLAGELEAAPRWLEQGLADLGREADRQICADGTSVEQAFSYHVFVIDLLLLTTAVLDAAGVPVPTSLSAAIERSGDALWAQLGDDEPAPTYGDSDDGRALILDARDLRDARGAAAAIAARFGHAKSARVAKELDVTAWWLFGEAGADRFEGVDSVAEPGSVTLADGGLTILRAGRRRTIVDHGPHGYLNLAAHAHADALRLDLALGEVELVADPGVGSYFAQPKLREAFRGTGFHATVEVDGVDSSTPGGPFLWTRHAEARLVLADVANGFVVADHDGYERLEDPVTHRRAVVVLADESILVVDRLDGRNAHRYSQRWPLHPALELERRSRHCFVARGREAGLVLAFSASHPFVVEAVRGQEDPPAGWWSPRLESVTPSWRASVDLEAAGVVEVAALLAPFEGDSASDVHLEIELTPAETRVQVMGASGVELVEIALGSKDVTVRRSLTAGAA